MRRQKVVASGFALSGIVAMLATLLVSGCGGSVGMNASRDEKGRLVVNLKPNWRVNSILDVAFWVEGDPESVWRFKQLSRPVRHIVYAEVPNGSRQTFPKDRVPPKPLPETTILCVSVTLQWDSILPPAAGTSSSTGKLLLTEDGGVEHLGDAVFTDAGLAYFKNLTGLPALNLSGVKITDAGLSHLKGLTKLQDISLRDTKITDAGLARLNGLRELNLRYTKITDAGLKHLKGMTGLQELNLMDTKITDAGLPHLKVLTDLRYLSLRDTSVTKAGVTSLRKVLPEAYINY